MEYKILIYSMLFLMFAIPFISAENQTETSYENSTEINDSIINIEESLENYSLNLIIITPSGNINSLTPTIEISTDDNVESCWYNITTATNTNTEVITFREIDNCESQVIPSGGLTYSIKYILNVLIQDSLGNTNISSSEFTTPEPDKSGIKIVNENHNENNNNQNVKIVNEEDNDNNIEIDNTNKQEGGIFELIKNFIAWLKSL